MVCRFDEQLARVIEVQGFHLNRAGEIYLAVKEMPPATLLDSKYSLSKIRQVTKIKAPQYFVDAHRRDEAFGQVLVTHRAQEAVDRRTAHRGARGRAGRLAYLRPGPGDAGRVARVVPGRGREGQGQGQGQGERK